MLVIIRLQHVSYHARLGVFLEVTMKIAPFWDMTKFILVHIHRHYSSTLKMWEEYFSETSVNIFQIPQRHIKQDSNIRCYYHLSIFETLTIRLWGLEDNSASSHDDRFMHSSNVTGITSAIWEAIVLVLVMRGISDLRHWDGPSSMILYIPVFMKTATGV
jgi:hypothetical protein